MLKTKKVLIDGTEYEFREPTVEQMLPVLGKLQDEEQRFSAQVDILKLTVFLDGNPCGHLIGISKLSDFAPHALFVCGMGDDDDSAD
jgi:hypothetical protein